MTFHRSRPGAIAALLLLLLSACEGGSDQSLSPTGPDDLLFGDGLAGYTLANDPILPKLIDQAVSVSQLVGVGGGSIELFGHRLTVPVGAVLEPTLFTLVALPSGHVEVHLTAVSTNLLGRVINVGTKGFRKPVRVTLTYSRSTNVTDPAGLFVLRGKGLSGEPEVMPSTVDVQRQTVSAELDHFSRYYIAMPD